MFMFVGERSVLQIIALKRSFASSHILEHRDLTWPNPIVVVFAKAVAATRVGASSFVSLNLAIDLIEIRKPGLYGSYAFDTRFVNPMCNRKREWWEKIRSRGCLPTIPKGVIQKS